MDGTGFVLSDLLDGMLVFGIWLGLWDLQSVVHLVLRVLNRGRRFRVDVLRSGGVGLS